MTSLESPPAAADTLPISHPRLPSWAGLVVAVIAVSLAGLITLLLDWGVVALAVVALLLFTVGLPIWSLILENRRSAVDRLMTNLVWAASLVAVLPLVWLVWLVVAKGGSAVNGEFLMSSMRNVVGAGGGIHHAIFGTLLVTLVAALISVPIGLFTAIYLVEYGKGSRLARWTTFLVDVMTGIPSIVAGLFALALFVLVFGPEIRNGFMGSVALSLLMIPIVVRSSEEMLRLVPDDLREASYALGVPKWRTIVKVVIPTALGGIITGITLAVARVIGETAPLLLTAGLTDSDNFNPFSERMTTLPVYIFSQFSSPGVRLPDGSDPPGFARAWGAALVLIVIVMALNIVARIIGKIFAPASSRRS